MNINQNILILRLADIIANVRSAAGAGNTVSDEIKKILDDNLRKSEDVLASYKAHFKKETTSFNPMNNQANMLHHGIMALAHANDQEFDICADRIGLFLDLAESTHIQSDLESKQNLAFALLVALQSIKVKENKELLKHNKVDDRLNKLSPGFNFENDMKPMGQNNSLRNNREFILDMVHSSAPNPASDVNYSEKPKAPTSVKSLYNKLSGIYHLGNKTAVQEEPALNAEPLTEGDAAIKIQRAYEDYKKGKAFKKLVNEAVKNKNQILSGVENLLDGQSFAEANKTKKETKDLNEMRANKHFQRIIESRNNRYEGLTKRNELLNALYGRDISTMVTEALSASDPSIDSPSLARKRVHTIITGKISAALIAEHKNVEISLEDLQGMGVNVKNINSKLVENIVDHQSEQKKKVQGIKIPVMYMDKAHNQLKPLDIDVEVKYDAENRKKDGYERGIEDETELKILGMGMGKTLTGKRGYKLSNWLGHKIDPRVSSKSLDTIYNPNNDEKKAIVQNCVAGAIGIVSAFWLILTANQVATGTALIGTAAIPGIGPAIVLGVMAVMLTVIIGVYAYNHRDFLKDTAMKGLLVTALLLSKGFEILIAKPIFAAILIAASALRFAINSIGNVLKVVGIVITGVVGTIGLGIYKAYAQFTKNGEMIELLFKEVKQLRIDMKNPDRTPNDAGDDIKEEVLAQTTSAKVDVLFNQLLSILSFQGSLIIDSTKSLIDSLTDVATKLYDVIAPMLGWDNSETIRARTITSSVMSTSSDDSNSTENSHNAADVPQQKGKYQEQADKTNASLKRSIGQGQDILFHGNVSESIVSLFPKPRMEDDSEMELLPLIDSPSPRSDS